MAVIFDGPDACTVEVPHGTYRVTRSQPANDFYYLAYPVGFSPEDERTHFSGLNVSNSGKVSSVRFGVGPFSLELLDVLVLAAMAFRDRDAPRKAA